MSVPLRLLNVKCSVKFRATAAASVKSPERKSNIISRRLIIPEHGRVTACAFISASVSRVSHLNISGLKSDVLTNELKQHCEALPFVHCIEWNTFKVDNITAIGQLGREHLRAFGNRITERFTTHSNFEKFPATFLRKRKDIRSDCVKCENLILGARGHILLFRSAKAIVTGGKKLSHLEYLFSMLHNVLRSSDGQGCHSRV